MSFSKFLRIFQRINNRIFERDAGAAYDAISMDFSFEDILIAVSTHPDGAVMSEEHGCASSGRTAKDDAASRDSRGPKSRTRKQRHGSPLTSRANGEGYRKNYSPSPEERSSHDRQERSDSNKETSRGDTTHHHSPTSTTTDLQQPRVGRATSSCSCTTRGRAHHAQTFWSESSKASHTGITPAARLHNAGSLVEDDGSPPYIADHVVPNKGRARAASPNPGSTTSERGRVSRPAHSATSTSSRARHTLPHREDPEDRDDEIPTEQSSNRREPPRYEHCKTSSRSRSRTSSSLYDQRYDHDVLGYVDERVMFTNVIKALQRAGVEDNVTLEFEDKNPIRRVASSKVVAHAERGRRMKTIWEQLRTSGSSLRKTTSSEDGWGRGGGSDDAGEVAFFEDPLAEPDRSDEHTRGGHHGRPRDAPNTDDEEDGGLFTSEEQKTLEVEDEKNDDFYNNDRQRHEKQGLPSVQRGGVNNVETTLRSSHQHRHRETSKQQPQHVRERGRSRTSTSSRGENHPVSGSARESKNTRNQVLADLLREEEVHDSGDEMAVMPVESYASDKTARTRKTEHLHQLNQHEEQLEDAPSTLLVGRRSRSTRHKALEQLREEDVMVGKTRSLPVMVERARSLPLVEEVVALQREQTPVIGARNNDIRLRDQPASANKRLLASEPDTDGDAALQKPLVQEPVVQHEPQSIKVPEEQRSKMEETTTSVLFTGSETLRKKRRRPEGAPALLMERGTLGAFKRGSRNMEPRAGELRMLGAPEYHRGRAGVVRHFRSKVENRFFCRSLLPYAREVYLFQEATHTWLHLNLALDVAVFLFTLLCFLYDRYGACVANSFRAIICCRNKRKRRCQKRIFARRCRGQKKTKWE
ncbi:unnamed protein product [Amoebophrya sp. A25]|nr:unnamed protein product [Amoebophrya sp. A25]|eukprot:GSA25T00025415001.1